MAEGRRASLGPHHLSPQLRQWHLKRAWRVWRRRVVRLRAARRLQQQEGGRVLSQVLGAPPPGRVLSQVLGGTPPPAGLPKLGPHLDISELGAPSCPVEESVPLRKHSLDSDLAAGRVLSPVLPCHSAWEQGSVTAQLPLNASPRWVWVPGCPLPHLPHSEHSSPDHRSELF